MKILTSPIELQKILKQQKKTIGFVPTMGALHDGHASLIKRSINENDITVVSIFVNPTQFLASEDLEKYPKRLETDLKICSLAGVDIVFTPNVNEIYFKNEITLNAPINKGFILEGFSRPGHFDGMLRVVLKLLHIVSPTNAYFGKKDAQQLYLIKQMVRDLFLDLSIIECDTVREKDGLALSSRNVYLSSEDRQKALSLSKSLQIATALVQQNQYDCDVIKNEMLNILEKDTNVTYIEIVNKNFEKINKVELKNTIILVAAKVGETRMIDNIWI
jgi:pantoate--beta-alanine ligase